MPDCASALAAPSWHRGVGAADRMEVWHVRSRLSGSGAACTFAAELLQGGARHLIRRHRGGARGGPPRARAQRHLGGRFDAYHVARFPDLLRCAGDGMEQEFEFKKGWHKFLLWVIVVQY